MILPLRPQLPPAQSVNARSIAGPPATGTFTVKSLLVDKPSRPMHVGSVVLGLVLISVGLLLLVLVISGFFSH